MLSFLLFPAVLFVILKTMERNRLYFHTRPMIGAAAGALLGVLCGSFLPSAWVTISLAILALGAAVMLRKRTSWLLLFICFAILCARTYYIPKDAVPEGGYLLRGTLSEAPEAGKTVMHLTLRNVALDDVHLHAKATVKMPVADIRYGDRIEVHVTAKADADTQDRAKGIFTIAETGEIPVVLSQSNDAYGELLRLRRSFSFAVDRLYGDKASIAKGMLLGDRSDFTYMEQKQFTNSGILHLFAVSGMHITVLLTLIGSLLRTGKRWLNLLLIMVFASFYCVLTAFTPSVLRATFFLLALQLPLLQDRQSDPPSAYCFSLAAVLFLNPYSLYTASFLLSFGSMAGILLLTKPLTNLLHLPDNRLSRALIGSTAAIVGILPLQASLFGSVSWMSVPMSLLLAPVLPILMPMAFLSVFLSPFMPHVAKGLSVIPYGALVYIDRLTAWLQTTPLQIREPHILSVGAYYAGLIMCSQLFLSNRRHPPYIGLALLGISVILWVIL